MKGTVATPITVVGVGLLLGGLGIPAWADTEPSFGLDTQLVEQSPVLRRWLQGTPNVLEEILSTPARPTRVQVGFVTRQQWFVGIEDLYVSSRVSVSGDFDDWQAVNLQQTSTTLRYYVSPLGSRLNLAPQVGYRWLSIPGEQIQGVEVGATAVAVLAPQAADISLDYRWLTGADPATTLSLSTAYALSRDFRVATRYRWQNSTLTKDFQVGLTLEWTP
ncbi:MAG: hypothetical protein OHK0012_09320 [Synechococcales cyanobacterium]